MRERRGLNEWMRWRCKNGEVVVRNEALKVDSQNRSFDNCLNINRKKLHPLYQAFPCYITRLGLMFFLTQSILNSPEPPRNYRSRIINSVFGFQETVYNYGCYHVFTNSTIIAGNNIEHWLWGPLVWEHYLLPRWYMKTFQSLSFSLSFI